MELKQIRQFLAVAETLNFRKAADQLHMTQPPLSVSIKRLEATLGVPLFTRTRTGVKLTEFGTALIPDARRFVFQAEQLQRSAATMSAGLTGRLRIAFVGSVTYELLPAILPRFRTEYPAVTLDLAEGTTTAIVAGVEAGTIDLGLVRYPLVESTSAAAEPVRWDTLIAALPSDSALSKKKRLHLDDLADEPFILYSASAAFNLRAQVMLACQAAGFRPQVVQEAVQVQTVVSLVESGLGVGLVPAVCQRHLSHNVAFRKIIGMETHLRVALAAVWRKDEELEITKRFRSFLLGNGNIDRMELPLNKRAQPTAVR